MTNSSPSLSIPIEQIDEITPKSLWRKFLRIRIQEKLILAFLAMGLIPMVVSLRVAGLYQSDTIHQDMKRKLDGANALVQQRMIQYEETAARCAMALAARPDLIQALREKDDERVRQICAATQAEFQLEQVRCDSLLPPEVRREVYGGAELGKPLKTVMLGLQLIEVPIAENAKASTVQTGQVLLSGCKMEIVDQGEALAELSAGNNVANKFGQQLGLQTGLQIVPCILPDPPEIPAIPSDFIMSEEIWERVCRSDSARHVNVKYCGNEYLALFHRVEGKSGKRLGFIFIGHLRSDSFRSILENNEFFLVNLCLNLGLATLMGIIIARSISKPIRRLTRGVRGIAMGRFDQKIIVRTHDELQDLATNFNNMSDRLKTLRQLEEQLRVQDRLAALGELSAGVAHEIRNPLGIIKGSAEILRRKFPEDDPRRELADFIVTESDRLNKVVTEFLQFARPTPPKLQPVDVNAAVSRTIEMIHASLSERNITLFTTYDPDIPQTLLDPEKMHQVFLNLLINAADSMEQGGEVIVKTHYAPLTGEVRIAFQDAGHGIPEDELDRIFNPFFTTKSGGTGLGLAIVQRVLESHEGRVEVSSTPGKGTCFVLIFPVRENEEISGTETVGKERAYAEA